MPRIYIHKVKSGELQKNTALETYSDRFFFLLKLINTSMALNGGKPLKAPTAKYIIRRRAD